MTLPRKGSRKIVVGGEEYRWAVRRRPTYCEANECGNLTAAVELYDSPKSVLLIDFPFPRPDSWKSPMKLGMSVTDRSVTPATIAKCIREAIGNGWDPRASGQAFEHNVAAQ